MVSSDLDSARASGFLKLVPVCAVGRNGGGVFVNTVTPYTNEHNLKHTHKMS